MTEETTSDHENIPALVFKARPSIYNEKYLPQTGDPPDLPERPKKRFISAVRAVSRNSTLKKKKKKNESSFMSVVEAVSKSRKTNGDSSSTNNNTVINPEQNEVKDRVKSTENRDKRKDMILYIMIALCFILVILLAVVLSMGYLYLKPDPTYDALAATKTSKNDFSLLSKTTKSSQKLMSIYLSNAKNLILDGNDLLCISKTSLRVFSLDGCLRRDISLDRISAECHSVARAKTGDFVLVCDGSKPGAYLMSKNGDKTKLIDPDKHLDVAHYKGKEYIIGCKSISVLNIQTLDNWNIDQAIYLRIIPKCHNDRKMIITESMLYVWCSNTRMMYQYSLFTGAYIRVTNMYKKIFRYANSFLGRNEKGHFVLRSGSNVFVCSVTSGNCSRSTWRMKSTRLAITLHRERNTLILWELYSSELIKMEVLVFNL